MQQRTFDRIEKKFLLTQAQKEFLTEEIQKHLSFDPNIIKGQPYHIYNLYYDTSDFQFIRRSLNKPSYKDKIRLRTYHYPLTDHDSVFLEIKKKYQGRINKRRIVMTYKEFKDYLNNHYKPDEHDYLNQQIYEEINYLLTKDTLKPKAYIAYERLAFHNASDSLRVTFDHNIRFRTDQVKLDDMNTHQILESESEWLMEIKSTQNFPFWLVQLLSEHRIFSKSFSKYGKAYEQFITGGYYENKSISNT